MVVSGMVILAGDFTLKARVFCWLVVSINRLLAKNTSVSSIKRHRFPIGKTNVVFVSIPCRRIVHSLPQMQQSRGAVLVRNYYWLPNFLPYFVTFEGVALNYGFDLHVSFWYDV